jgi:hypothetical protein
MNPGRVNPPYLNKEKVLTNVGAFFATHKIVSALRRKDECGLL